LRNLEVRIHSNTKNTLFIIIHARIQGTGSISEVAFNKIVSLTTILAAHRGRAMLRVVEIFLLFEVNTQTHSNLHR